MATLQDLVIEAARLGATVHLAHLPEGMRAHCDVFRREILVDINLTMGEKKEALAHELGHYRYGHTCSTESNERRAFRHAARLLVDVEDYRAAAALHPGDTAAIADELNLPRRIVRVFEKEWLPTISLRRRSA